MLISLPTPLSSRMNANDRLSLDPFARVKASTASSMAAPAASVNIVLVFVKLLVLPPNAGLHHTPTVNHTQDNLAVVRLVLIRLPRLGEREHGANYRAERIHLDQPCDLRQLRSVRL